MGNQEIKAVWTKKGNSADIYEPIQEKREILPPFSLKSTDQKEFHKSVCQDLPEKREKVLKILSKSVNKPIRDPKVRGYLQVALQEKK